MAAFHIRQKISPLHGAGYLKYDLPACVPALDEPVRVRGLCEWKDMADHRVQPAGPQHLRKSPGAVAVVPDQHAVKGDVVVQNR
jgi:hypothetical protein